MLKNFVSHVCVRTSMLLVGMFTTASSRDFEAFMKHAYTGNKGVLLVHTVNIERLQTP